MVQIRPCWTSGMSYCCTHQELGQRRSGDILLTTKIPGGEEHFVELVGTLVFPRRVDGIVVAQIKAPGLYPCPSTSSLTRTPVKPERSSPARGRSGSEPARRKDRHIGFAGCTGWRVCPPDSGWQRRSPCGPCHPGHARTNRPGSGCRAAARVRNSNNTMASRLAASRHQNNSVVMRE